jgi:hypothetical protein
MKQKLLFLTGPQDTRKKREKKITLKIHSKDLDPDPQLENAGSGSTLLVLWIWVRYPGCGAFLTPPGSGMKKILQIWYPGSRIRVFST